MDIQYTIKQLFARIEVLTEELSRLRKENTALVNKVSDLENKLFKKNSKNSSIPPSKDENRVKPNQSLRKKSGKKSGGQKGHKGDTLKMLDTADQIVDHKYKYCINCQEALVTEQEQIGKRQVVDIPPIKPMVTEHRIYKCLCKCGHVNQSSYPKEASSPISYGNNVVSSIGYLSVGQYMSMGRIVELFDQMYNIKLSQGTICNLLEKLTTKCMPIYDQIKKRILSSRVVGSDETGCVVNGKKWWMWTWQNELLTYIAASESRGYKAITDNFKDGLPNAVLVSDSWASQLKTPAKLHQLCLAHIQREMKYFIEGFNNRWCRKFLKLIYEALSLKKSILLNPHTDFENQIKEIKAKGSVLLNQTVKGNKKMQALKKRLSKYEKSLWVFLEYKEVPPDNNGAERAIRNVKIKQKVSGQFRSQKGAQQFAVIRSVYDTIRKNNGQAFNTLALVAKSVPE